jgi:hypothetical protein
LDVLDQFDRDLETIADLDAAPEIFGGNEIDGPKNIMKRDFCVTLVPGISAKGPQLEAGGLAALF